MKTNRTSWERRLTPHAVYTAKCSSCGEYESELTLSFESDSGFEFGLVCAVFAEYEPAQNGGRTDPSWSAHFYAASAYYFRPGHGWKKVSLSDVQKDDILLHFSDKSDYDDHRG